MSPSRSSVPSVTRLVFSGSSVPKRCEPVMVRTTFISVLQRQLDQIVQQLGIGKAAGLKQLGYMEMDVKRAGC